jgi:hypothetical protein
LQAPTAPIQYQQANSGMRDSYIESRLQPHVADFVSICLSYLPYFSYISSKVNDLSSPSTSQTTSIVYDLHNGKLHPTETYAFLSTLTRHWLNQPSLTRTLLGEQLAPRLKREWEAWLDRVDLYVNQEGGMFGKDAVSLWSRELDEFAEVRDNEVQSVMRPIRNAWVSKVGWLDNRRPSHGYAMEEL